MVDYTFSIFHKWILPFFILIFIAGCGYKGDPFYGDEPQKNSKTENLNKL
jgi:hypothetical protein